MSRFGVQLVETSKTETEDDIVIPEQIQSILLQFKKSASCGGAWPESQQLLALDSISSVDATSHAKETTAGTSDLGDYKWIEELLQDLPEERNDRSDMIKGKDNRPFSSGPILPIEADITPKMSTSQKELFYKVLLVTAQK